MSGEVLARVQIRRAIRLLHARSSQEGGFVVSQGEDGAPVFTGPGDLDYLCGACGMLLCEGVRPGLFVGVLFACRCGAENQVPPGNALVDRQPTLVRPVDLPE